MGMQRRVHEVGAKFDDFYNNTAVDYSLQIDAYWQRLRARMPAKAGREAVDNVVYADFSSQDKIAEIIPPIELAQES